MFKNIMAWKNISDYLNKFFVITPPKKFYQNETVKVINKILNINLSENDMEYRFGVIYIKNNPVISGLLKNEIFLNKNKIIQTLSKIKNIKVVDIRFQ